MDSELSGASLPPRVGPVIIRQHRHPKVRSQLYDAGLSLHKECGVADPGLVRDGDEFRPIRVCLTVLVILSEGG